VRVQVQVQVVVAREGGTAVGGRVRIENSVWSVARARCAKKASKASS
jgi:hypothetical protein